MDFSMVRAFTNMKTMTSMKVISSKALGKGKEFVITYLVTHMMANGKKT